MKPQQKQSLKPLFAQLPKTLGAERFALRRDLQSLERQTTLDEKRLERVEKRITESVTKRNQRIQNVPAPQYPADLPVAQRRDEIIAAIKQHQVVIICGETGSGKTTQLPKMCLEAGRGIDGFIGHTQPRRIAARSVAERIAEELETPLGQHVGYKVRFQDKIQPTSYVKLMTDGILLAEIQQDRYLNDYDTLIIDEAHERSLNIDFLLGYLKWLLPKRRDLKVIITSATIDPERFANHFDNAPILMVSGRTYPVEIRYRPLIDIESDDEDERDITDAIIDAVDELRREGSGDILVFMSGEREIRETAEALTKHLPPAYEVLPLFARLSAEEQHRIFEPHGRPRVILATNVAETSLTVPGIKYVVDTGLARISRYSWRAGVQRLPIEKISQASANQRSGRCGRVSDGIAIRLYSEDDYKDRPLFTEPEILRTNLASVILQMETMRLGDMEQFPFVEKPDVRLIRDGYKLLFEIGAVDDDYNVTPLGQTLSRLPLDPRYGRMLLSAHKEGALKEVLVIVAALAVQDPRERPLERQQAADEKHARFKNEDSDFLSYLLLWNYIKEQKQQLSKSQFRKQAKKEFLSWVRIQEWEDIHYQIKSTLLDSDLKENDKDAEYNAMHRALLSGLLSNIGLKDEDFQYQGANGRKFMIFPGSYLKKKNPQWIMAAELVETTKLYGRTVAKIQPEWVEEFGHHLIKHHYTEPHWEQKPANVAASERTSLYGITITPKRKISFGTIDPIISRQLFIRHALVYGEYAAKGAYAQHNAELIAKVEELEAKGRRRDILADEQLLFDFFEQRIPEHVYSGHAFERWRKQAEAQDPKILYLTLDYLMQREAEHERSNLYPDTLHVQGMVLALKYHFDPTAEDDGVTAQIPLLALNQLTLERFEYLVPGLLEEKMTALIRGLPKHIRKQFVPAPDYARACLEAVHPSESISLTEAMGKQLLRMSGTTIPKEAWEQVELAPHLLMRFEVVDNAGVVVQQGRDLNALQNKVRQQTRAQLSTQPMINIERDQIKTWDFGDLPEVHWIETSHMKLRAWPALVDKGDHVAIELFDSEWEAHQAHRGGVLRLFQLALPTEMRDLAKHIPALPKLCMQYAATGKCEELRASVARYAFRQAFKDYLDIRKQADFQQALTAARKNIFPQVQELSRLMVPAFEAYHDIRKQLKSKFIVSMMEAVNDMNEQLDHLVYVGFLETVEPEQLRHYPRYLKAMQRRLEKLKTDPNKDLSLRQQIHPYWQKYLAYLKANRVLSAGAIEFRWMLEEFRVSLFAQELGTAKPVSAKRLDNVWENIA
ncbi:ATP-dependent RNA helicase HrpA [Thiofilum flexile]|uniref:ATP-dependent RNA helicase HrpA n=1 Tax=Thiofilum flexile TaxID=125627 RepID=UPI00036ED0F7|nr:ATP-dependent RNA helicase HrpA [Thiofilum flexile]